MFFLNYFNFSVFLINLYWFLKNQNEENTNRLKRSVVKCGPICIKLLQFMIMRENLIKTDKLNYLLEHCEIHDWEYTKDCYLKDFGKEICDDFFIDENYDQEVIGSGSIGQVYKLFSYKLNEYTAVKVKHPDINNQVINFVKIVKNMLFLFGYFFKIKYIIIQFIDNIESQLNYQKEAENTRKLKGLYLNQESLIIPEIYSVSNNFIVMSYHTGNTFHNVKNKTLVSLMINLFVFKTFLIHDFLHADFHFGNFKITNDYRLIIYDCSIFCTTGDVIFNRKLLNFSMNNDYVKLINILTTDKNKIKLFLEIVKNDTHPKLRIKDIFSILIKMKICNDKKIINVLSSIAMYTDILYICTNKITSFISNEKMIYIYIGLLEKMKIFPDIKENLIEWVNSDKQIKIEFDNWLLEEFGHSDETVIYDIIHSIIHK